MPIPLAPEQFTRQPDWVEFIRGDPLTLREVRPSFFLKQALWDRRILRSRDLRLPLLLLQAGDDDIVDVPAVKEWFEEQPANRKQYVDYPDFAHILDFEPERQRYWDDLAGWLDGVAASRPQVRGGGGASTSRIQTIELLTVRLPFRFSFGHSLAERSSSVNVLVRLTLANGIVGYGEGVPRDYVTGETVEGALEALHERQAPVVIGRELTTIEDVPALAAEIPFTAEDGSLDTAARCALELALLDAAGKHFGCSVAAWLPQPAEPRDLRRGDPVLVAAQARAARSRRSPAPHPSGEAEGRGRPRARGAIGRAAPAPARRGVGHPRRRELRLGRGARR